MRRSTSTIAPVAVRIVGGGCTVVPIDCTPVQGQTRQESGSRRCRAKKAARIFSAAYEIVPNWPKPLRARCRGTRSGRGERGRACLPRARTASSFCSGPAAGHRAAEDACKIAPSIEFPIGRLPWRDATSASPRALFGPDGRPRATTWTPASRAWTIDWAHCIVVVDANGNHIEDWTQWDKMLRRPHAVYISPYDPEKHVWIVDDYRHAIFKFTNDGKKLRADDRRAERARQPTTSTSIGRRSWPGCPTARSSSPTGTPTRAS